LIFVRKEWIFVRKRRSSYAKGDLRTQEAIFARASVIFVIPSAGSRSEP
jgi:hypothetical protein